MNHVLCTIAIVADPTPVLACPRCGNSNTRPTSVRCNPAGELPGQVSVEEAGILWNPTVDMDKAGPRIELVFSCEAGHSFAVIFQFRRGRTHVSRSCEPVDAPTNVIWPN